MRFTKEIFCNIIICYRYRYRYCGNIPILLCYSFYSLSREREREREKFSINFWKPQLYCCSCTFQDRLCSFLLFKKQLEIQITFPLNDLSFYVSYFAWIEIFFPYCFITDSKKCLVNNICCAYIKYEVIIMICYLIHFKKMCSKNKID